MIRAFSLVFAEFLLLSPLLAQAPIAFLNTDLRTEARITNLLGSMTLDEKIAALGTSTAVPRLGVS